MKDWTTSCYCNFLWIHDLFRLDVDENKNLICNSGLSANRTKTIRNVSIFGTIIEVKDLGDLGMLYSVDDGTGVIVCKDSSSHFCEVLNFAEAELANSLNQTVIDNKGSQNETLNEDSVFNDQSIQMEEDIFLKRNRILSIQSILRDITSSFNRAVTPYTVGDSVYITGKIYLYFKVPQIYVNSIRPMSMREECVKIRQRMYDTQESLTQSNFLSEHGTFDNVHHMEAKRSFTEKVPTPKRRGEDLDRASKRLSIIPPACDITMTFDTLEREDEEK